MKYNTLLIGNGGREHAIFNKIKESKSLGEIYSITTNPVIAENSKLLKLDINSNEEIIKACKDNKIDLVIIGPEGVLAQGLVDALESNNILAFGPTKAAASLEVSKDFTKKICDARSVPTAKYHTFTKANISTIDQFLSKFKQDDKIVVKADGLAAGKGVVICNSPEEAKKETITMLDGSFGSAGEKVVVEEFLDGHEVSAFYLCNGTNATFLTAAKDYKKIGEGETGLNTGGMGSVCHKDIISKELEEKVRKQIVLPTLEEMSMQNTPFKGVLFVGLMICKGEPFLLEYNTRFGDPETQSIMALLESDIIEIAAKLCKGELKQSDLKISDKYAMTVVLSNTGYPESFTKGDIITGLDLVNNPSISILHAGTTLQNSNYTATGGRVICITATSEASFEEASQLCYQTAETINWPNKYYRKDIGWNARK